MKFPNLHIVWQQEKILHYQTHSVEIHTQLNKQASVARILFAGFFGKFSTSINKNLLDAQINEYNKKTTKHGKCIR